MHYRVIEGVNITCKDDGMMNIAQFCIIHQINVISLYNIRRVRELHEKYGNESINWKNDNEVWVRYEIAVAATDIVPGFSAELSQWVFELIQGKMITVDALDNNLERRIEILEASMARQRTSIGQLFDHILRLENMIANIAAAARRVVPNPVHNPINYIGGLIIGYGMDRLLGR